MLLRSIILCLCVISWLSHANAGDIDMQRLQQLIDLSDQIELEQNTQASTPQHHTTTSQTPAREYISLQNNHRPQRVLIDVRTTHSDGKHDMPTLIQWAEKRGIDSLAFTEHDRFSMRIGIDPMPNILGYSMQHPSLYLSGLENFFADLNQQRAQHPELQLFAGTESIPGYTWSGIPFKNLSLHNVERHLITLGIEHPEQVEGLSSYDLRHGYGNRALSIAFWCGLIFLLIIILMRRRKRSMALLLMASFIAFLTSWLMKPAVDADSDFINSAHKQGLFVIWAHPGTLSGVREGPMGVYLDTPPYNQRVFTDPTADAFAAVYGDTDQNTTAGGLWDRYMEAYMFGRHAKPIWAAAAGDYHEEGMANEYLGNYPMDVWSANKQPTAIISAMQHGHMVAWGLSKKQNLSMQTLYLEDSHGQHLLPGDEAKVQGAIHVVAALGQRTPSNTPSILPAQWIVDGKVIKTITLNSHATKALSIALQLSKGPHVIRLQIKQGARMVANPFLVHVE